MNLLINGPEHDRCNAVTGTITLVAHDTKDPQKTVRKHSSNKERCVLNNSNSSSHANNRDLFSAFGMEEVSTDKHFTDFPSFSIVNSLELKLSGIGISGYVQMYYVIH